MWKHMARIVGEIKPKYVFIENSAMLRTRGLGTVLQDLAEMGYNAEWGVLSAAAVGANHKRERMWIVAYSDLPQCQRGSVSSGVQEEDSDTCDSRWWKDSSRVHRMDDGVAARVDRLKAIGNGQVPLCAATAWKILNERANSC